VISLANIANKMDDASLYVKSLRIRIILMMMMMRLILLVVMLVRRRRWMLMMVDAVMKVRVRVVRMMEMRGLCGVVGMMMGVMLGSAHHVHF
jgi:hypothetical protein